jgi:two-component system sensor histidine kinase YesM
MVMLEREIAHVEAYMLIQNVRFDGRIQLKTEVPEALRTCPVPKILLQPLVENAIQHGIREREDESGTIWITARELPDGILLIIRDVGVGLSSEVLRSLNDPHAKSKGYGVRNTNDRLMLHYGFETMLRFESRPGEGTTVTIRIPWVRKTSGGM